MVKGEIFNTQVGYDLDSRSWTKIGKKEQWKYLGREQGKSKWVRDHRFPDAEKAEGTRNHFCCEALCYPLVVHQGPVNQWFFRRHSKNSVVGPRKSTVAPCITQKLINNLPLMDQSELIGAAKTFLCQFLNNEAGGKEEFEVESAKIDSEISNYGVVPSITIVHTGESRSETYVEIRVRDEIHHDSKTWGFYEVENSVTGKPWMDQLIPLHFKGKESGVRYDVASLPTQIVGQFRRRFIDRTNISKQWEDSRDLINKKEVEIQRAAEEEERRIIREKEREERRIIREKEANERDLKLRMNRLEAEERRKKKSEKAKQIFHDYIRSLESRGKRPSRRPKHLDLEATTIRSLESRGKGPSRRPNHLDLEATTRYLVGRDYLENKSNLSTLSTIDDNIKKIERSLPSGVASKIHQLELPGDYEETYLAIRRAYLKIDQNVMMNHWTKRFHLKNTKFTDFLALSGCDRSFNNDKEVVECLVSILQHIAEFHQAKE